MRNLSTAFFVTVTALTALTPAALAVPEFIEHIPANAVYGEPGGTTMRQPASPNAGDTVKLWIKIGYSFYYTDVAIYYTTDGSTPAGSFGSGSSSTQVLRSSNGGISFIRNEPTGGPNIDWWSATLPPAASQAGVTVKYFVGAWHSGGGIEAYGNNYGCADGTCDNASNPKTIHSYTVGSPAFPWPGKGHPFADHTVGYPPVSLWKEEGVVGNNNINVQLDQNGTIYDIYYPSAGCAQGVATKNEGYVDGLDTFPAGLPLGSRGQMNMNQAMGGLRIDGKTYWLSNVNGASYNEVDQYYQPKTNVIYTTAHLYDNSNNITVTQYDFSPKGVTYPNDQGGNPNKGIYIKRYLITNNGPTTKNGQFYFYGDFALNGGDGFDVMDHDLARGAMYAKDTTFRNAGDFGEYNPTSFGSYSKNVSLYLAAAMKLAPAPGAAGGAPATNSWRQVSSDDSQGWIGMNIELPPGATREVDVAVIGGFDPFPNANGTYAYQIAPVIDWFLAGNMSQLQDATETYWQNWVNSGTTIDFPDPAYEELFERGLLATALHQDERNGGIIAGMHNGAYPFIWPRDAAWAAITLARTGHVGDAEEAMRFLRDVAYRDNESWGRKGWWKQKYTTDGYQVWTAPQIDETSCFPWAAKSIYDVTNDIGWLADQYDEAWEAAVVSVLEYSPVVNEDGIQKKKSLVDGRLFYNVTLDLVHSNNLWEDQFGPFNYSIASVIRGLEDAAAIADRLDQSWCLGGPGTCGYDEDKALFLARAAQLRAGLDGRLAWNGENNDVSQLGITYPFEVYPPGHPRAELILNRIRGAAGNNNGQFQPLVNGPGEWEHLVNRYWSDAYWHNASGPNSNASPWYLTTMWYGAYHALRQDLSPGKADIGDHKLRLDRLIAELGPIGFGAEQIAPSNSLLYGGQNDFTHEAAWPNAWESMSFFVDSIMLFSGYEPDAHSNTLRVAPKLPAEWCSITFNNLELRDHRVSLAASEAATVSTHLFTNNTGNAVDFETYVRIPNTRTPRVVTLDGDPHPYTYDAATGRTRVTGALNTGVGATTEVRVDHSILGDYTGDDRVSIVDFNQFALAMAGPDNPKPPAVTAINWAKSKLDSDQDVDMADLARFQTLFTGP